MTSKDCAAIRAGLFFSDHGRRSLSEGDHLFGAGQTVSVANIDHFEVEALRGEQQERIGPEVGPGLVGGVGNRRVEIEQELV